MAQSSSAAGKAVMSTKQTGDGQMRSEVDDPQRSSGEGQAENDDDIGEDERELRRLLEWSNINREAFDRAPPHVQKDVLDSLRYARKYTFDLRSAVSRSTIEAMEFFLSQDSSNTKKSEKLGSYLRQVVIVNPEHDLIHWLLKEGADTTLVEEDGYYQGMTAWDLAIRSLTPGAHDDSVAAALQFLQLETEEKLAPFEISWVYFRSAKTWYKDSKMPKEFWNYLKNPDSTLDWFTIGGNNLLWAILVTWLRFTQEKPVIEFNEVVRFMYRDFIEIRQPGASLGTREPCCIIDTLAGQARNAEILVRDDEEVEDDGNTHDEAEEQTDEEDADGDEVADGAMNNGCRDSERKKSPSDALKIEKTSVKLNYMSLSIPYLNPDLYTNLKERNTHVEAFARTIKYCQSRKDPKWTTLHLQLTLDEYCRPVLGRRLEDINKDQVITRYNKLKEYATLPASPPKSKKRRPAPPEELPDDARLITVRHFSLWRVHNTVVTGFIDRDRDFWDKISPNARDDPSERSIAQDLRIAKILSYLINLLDQPKPGSGEPILNVFENSISLLNYIVNRYVGHMNVEDLDFWTEMEFLHNIRDIRDELSMIKMVLQQQEEVWKEFISNTWRRYWKNDRLEPPDNDSDYSTDDWRMVARPQKQFQRYYGHIARLEEEADRVKDSISDRLDLQSKHASMKEAHANAVLSTAVFGFTIITIIFTPLSFVISLLGLPVHNYQSKQQESRWGDSGAYTRGFIAWNMAAGEAATVIVTGLAMWAAVEFLLLKNVKERWSPWLRKHFPAIFNQDERERDETKSEKQIEREHAKEEHGDISNSAQRQVKQEHGDKATTDDVAVSEKTGKAIDSNEASKTRDQIDSTTANKNDANAAKNNIITDDRIGQPAVVSHSTPEAYAVAASSKQGEKRSSWRRMFTMNALSVDVEKNQGSH